MKNDFKNSWLSSDNVFKRALSIWGHAMLGYICIIVLMMFLFGAIALVVGFFELIM